MFSLDKNSRVWVYQSDKLLSEEIQITIKPLLDEFVSGWAAHGVQLKAEGEIVDNRFVVIAVDNDFHQASGCSIDTSVRFIKEIEKKFGLNFFNRLKIWYRKDEESEFELVNFSQLKTLDEGYYYNTLVENIKEFETDFIRKI